MKLNMINRNKDGDLLPDSGSDESAEESEIVTDNGAGVEDGTEIGEECSFTVGPSDEGKRLDVYLTACLPDQSRSFIKKMLADGTVLLDDHPAKASTRVKSGQQVSAVIPAPLRLSVEPQDIPLDILYEDKDILVVNKPKGMVVYPAAGHPDGTLVNALLYHCGDSLSGINGVLRPGIVHRIDRDTTGSLVVCKNDAAHRCLAAQFKVHSITRKYRAIVIGNFPEDTGTIDRPIGRSRTDRKKMAVDPVHGRRAVTHYRVLERFGDYTYIECQLDTGRTHQIRVHMASIHHPILGDSVYGPKKCRFALEGQTLHAMVLGFRHPADGRYMEFTAPLPEYFEELLRRLRGR